MPATPYDAPSVAVALLGAPGSGKTELAGALLAAAGAPGLTSDGPGRLASGALTAYGTRVCLLDPPGSPELAGEVAAALRVASAVVLVLSPVQGLDARTVALWESVAHLPRVVVLTQLDRPGADADEAVAVCQRLLGEGVLPLTLPLHDDDGSVGGVLDLLHLQVTEGSETRAADAEHVTLVSALRDELLETVLTGSEDEEVFGRFLDDEPPEGAVLDAEVAAAVARGDLVPVLVAVPRRGVGLAGLVSLLATALPPAGEQPSPAVTAPDGSPVGEPGLVAELVRGDLLRVWAGRLEPGPLLVAGRPATYDGPVAGPGAVLASGLAGRPGDAVGSEPLLLEPWSLPRAVFAVGAPDDAGLAERVAADPVARLETDPRTGQRLLLTLGPAHAEVLLAGLPSSPVRVPPGGRAVAYRLRVPGWAERAVRTDLVARGGELVSSEPDDDSVLLEVRVPPSEAAGYALAAGRASAGTAVFV